MIAAEGFVVILQKADGKVEFRCVAAEPNPEQAAKKLARELVKGGEYQTAVMVPAFWARA